MCFSSAGTTYKVSVQTSNVNGAGTDAGVYVVIFGERGDSGEVKLVNSETNKKPFENNQLDVFTLSDILDLGKLFKLRVWHDNKGFQFLLHYPLYRCKISIVAVAVNSCAVYSAITAAASAVF